MWKVFFMFDRSCGVVIIAGPGLAAELVCLCVCLCARHRAKESAPRSRFFFNFNFWHRIWCCVVWLMMVASSRCDVDCRCIYYNDDAKRVLCFFLPFLQQNKFQRFLGVWHILAILHRCNSREDIHSVSHTTDSERSSNAYIVIDSCFGANATERIQQRRAG